MWEEAKERAARRRWAQGAALAGGGQARYGRRALAQEALKARAGGGPLKRKRRGRIPAGRAACIDPGLSLTRKPG